MIGGAGGRVLHADFEYPLEAVDYKPAAIELGDATIRGIGSQVYEPMLAVGDGGVVWRSEDRGETWRAVPLGRDWVHEAWSREPCVDDRPHSERRWVREVAGRPHLEDLEPTKFPPEGS